MQVNVKFEYECIAEDVNTAQFYHELRTYSEEMLISEVHGPVMQNANKLYGDKCFVALLHKWYECSKELDNLIDMLKARGVSDEEVGEKLDKSCVQRNYDAMSWLIADLL